MSVDKEMDRQMGIPRSPEKMQGRKGSIYSKGHCPEPREVLMLFDSSARILAGHWRDGYRAGPGSV